MVLHSLHTRGRVDQAPIDVSIDLTTKRKFVRSSENLSKGTLALPPCVPHASRVYDKSTHPHRVAIAVTEKSAVAVEEPPETRKGTKMPCEPQEFVYYVHPEYKMPEESKEELDDSFASHVRAREFKGEETLHPYWAVERLTQDGRRTAQKGNFNLTFESTEFAAVTGGRIVRWIQWIPVDHI